MRWKGAPRDGRIEDRRGNSTYVRATRYVDRNGPMDNTGDYEDWKKRATARSVNLGRGQRVSPVVKEVHDANLLPTIPDRSADPRRKPYRF